jgi:hypothetical protein
VLQIVTRSSLTLLSCFVGHPTKENASALVVIPALYNVLRLEEKTRAQTYPADVLGVCRWLVERTNYVLTILTIHTTPGVDEGIEAADKDWRQVSSISDMNASVHKLITAIRRAVAIACPR